MVVTDRDFWRWYLVLVSFFSAWYLFQWRNNAGTWFLLVSTSLVIAILALIFFNRINLERLQRITIKIPEIFCWLISLTLISTPSILTFLYPTQIVFHESGKFLLLLWMSGISVWVLQNSNRKRLSSINFLLLIILGGFLFRIGAFVPEIQRAPFSLGWSEGSR